LVAAFDLLDDRVPYRRILGVVVAVSAYIADVVVLVIEYLFDFLGD
jgi:hypothetical protein